MPPWKRRGPGTAPLRHEDFPSCRPDPTALDSAPARHYNKRHGWGSQNPADNADHSDDPEREDRTMKSWTYLVLVGLVATAVGAFSARMAKGDKETVKVDKRVFELRTYYANPGKMEALHTRFRDTTNKLFEKHGMTIIGFWTPIDPKEADRKLVYVLAFPSKEAADKSWQAFRDDPAWKSAKEASEKNGVLVEKVESVFLNPTDYSPVK
jgi:hypothetical protein